MTERFSPTPLGVQYDKSAIQSQLGKIARAIPWSATVGVADVLDYGAMGDGVRDDTAALQAAIDAAIASGSGIARGHPGDVYLVSSLDVSPGLVLDLNGATIKAAPSSPNFTRLLTTQNTLYSGSTDSAPLTIKNGTLDGNRQNQGTYTGYEKEQNQLLFLYGSSASVGRLVVKCENVLFKDSTSDGVSVYVNVDAQFTNCRSQDCFRGGLTATGGYSRIQVANWRDVGTTHPFGINVEVDAAGYGGSQAAEIQINGWNGGSFDVSLVGGTFIGSNMNMGAGFSLNAPSATVLVSDSVFRVGASATNNNRIVKPSNVTFQNVEFIATESAESGAEADRTFYAVRVYWNISGSTEQNQTLRLIDCRWSVAADVESTDTVYAVYQEADTSGMAGNTLVVEGGEISSGFDTAFRMVQGGNWKIRRVESKAATFMQWSFGVGRYATIEIDGVRVPSAATRYMLIESTDPSNTLTHRGVELDESVNVLATTSGTATNVYGGGRLIYGAAAPTAATHGLKGDRYRLKAPVAGSVYEYICTTGGLGAGAVWKALTTVAA